MADQIVIELIGDPSGLKPAEEALHQLSKAAEENLEAFKKANDAAAKFAAAAGGAAKSTKTLEEAVKESSKAMAQLNAGTEKGGAALKELGKRAEETADAFGKVNKPIEEFNKLTSEMGESATETMHDLLSISQAAEKCITNISNLNGIIAQGVVKEVTKDYSNWTLAIQANVAKHEYLKTKIAANTEEMDRLEKQGKKGGAAYKHLADENEKLGHSLGGVTTSLKNHGVAVEELGTHTKKAAGSHSFLEAAMHKIMHASKQEGEGFKGMHIILTAHDKTLLGVVGHTKELGNAMGEMAEAVGKATGNDKLGAEVKEKLAKAMQIVTVAQTALTVAQEAGTLAAIAFDAAIWPITLAIGALLAVGAGIAAIAGWFGSADDAAKKNTKTLEGQVKVYDELAESANTYVKQLEAEGATEEEIMKAKQKANEADQEALRAKIALQMDAIKNETDEAKKLEEQNKLKEMQTQLYDKTIESTKLEAENQKQITDGMREQGKTYEQIIKQKEKENDINDKNLDQQKEEIQVKIKALNATREILVLEGADTAEIDKQIKGLEKKVVVINEIKDLNKKADEESKKSSDDAKTAYTEQLSNAKTLAEARLSIAKTGSQEELKAKIADLQASAAVELNNVKGTEAQKAELRSIIHQKLQQDIDAATKATSDKKLQEEKKNLEVMLVLNKGNEAETLKLSLQLAEKERDIALSNTKLTANEKLLVEKNYKDKVKQLNDDEKAKNDAKRQKELDDLKATNLAKYEELIKAQQKKEEKEQELLKSSKATLDAQLEALKNEQIKELAIIEDSLKKGLIDEAEAAKQKEKINKQYGDSIKKTEDEITAKKKEEDKKREDLEKQLGKAAIDIGKQVADAIFAAQAEKRKQALDDLVGKLEAQKQHELSNHHLTAAQKKAIEEKYRKEEAAAKLKAWKADQAAKAEQAIINGLLAFAAALATDPIAGYINGAIALAMAGVQAGIILAKQPPKFAKGVIGLEGPGTETSDSIPAYLSKGESVITAENTRRYKPILEQIQAGTFDGLALPMLSTFPRLNDLGALVATHAAAGHAIDYDKLGQALAKALPKSKTQQLSFDKKGFSHYLLTESGKIESYNNRYKE